MKTPPALYHILRMRQRAVLLQGIHAGLAILNREAGYSARTSGRSPCAQHPLQVGEGVWLTNYRPPRSTSQFGWGDATFATSGGHYLRIDWSRSDADCRVSIGRERHDFLCLQQTRVPLVPDGTQILSDYASGTSNMFSTEEYLFAFGPRFYDVLRRHLPQAMPPGEEPVVALLVSGMLGLLATSTFHLPDNTEHWMATSYGASNSPRLTPVKHSDLMDIARDFPIAVPPATRRFSLVACPASAASDAAPPYCLQANLEAGQERVELRVQRGAYYQGFRPLDPSLMALWSLLSTG